MSKRIGRRCPGERADESGARSAAGPRQRTLQRMRQLLVVGAAAGMACDQGCGDGPAVVCDPLPPPIVCRTGLSSEEIFELLSANASWLDTGQGWVAAVSLSVLTQRSGLVFSGDPLAVGATVAALNRTSSTVAFHCRPATGRTEVALTIPMTCNGLTEELGVVLDISAAPVERGPIPITPGR